MKILIVAVLAAAVLLAGCSQRDNSPENGNSALAPAAAPAPISEPAPPATFINKVWKVRDSSAVAQGQLYAFLSDGTLVITLAGNKPALGAWTQEGDGLTWIEEGQPHKVEVLALTAYEFRVRVHSPGEPIEIAMVPADAAQSSGTAK